MSETNTEVEKAEETPVPEIKPAALCSFCGGEAMLNFDQNTPTKQANFAICIDCLKKIVTKLLNEDTNPGESLAVEG